MLTAGERRHVEKFAEGPGRHLPHIRRTLRIYSEGTVMAGSLLLDEQRKYVAEGRPRKMKMRYSLLDGYL